MRSYPDPTLLHSSLLWFTPNSGDDKEVGNAVSSLQVELDEEPIVETITAVTIKVGNRLYQIPLAAGSE
jgi:hypothetical protein